MLSDAIEELRAGRVAGVEVASVALPSCSSLLVAGLVPEGEGMVIELGRWPVSPQGVPEPSGAGLRLGTADLPLARRVLSRAEAALPMAVLGEEEIQDLAREGDLAAVVASGPDGQPQGKRTRSVTQGGAQARGRIAIVMAESRTSLPTSGA